MSKNSYGEFIFHSYFPVGSLGFGIVASHDTRKPDELRDIGYTGLPFIHKLSEKPGTEPLTDEETAEVKADCEALVKLLRKFYSEDDLVAE